MSALAAVVEASGSSYRILKWIGCGSFSQVFKIVRDNKIMACKQVKAIDPDFVLSEQRHVTVVKNGPHIAAVHDDVEWNPTTRTLSFFMEYYRGKDLERLIHLMRAAEARFTETQIIEIAYRIAVALSYCHGLNILHQDMKPMNVLLREPWNPLADPVIPDLYVADFGMASHLETLGAKSREQRGTPCYEAPEIRRQGLGNFSPKSDIYAFGCILFRLCTLNEPDHAAGLKPFEISQDYSIDLLSLISSMLSSDCADRPTAANVKEQLMVLIRNNISPNARECEKCGNVFLSNNQLRKHMKASHRGPTGVPKIEGVEDLGIATSESSPAEIWIDDVFDLNDMPMPGQFPQDDPVLRDADPNPCVVCMRNFNSKKRFFQHLHCQHHWRSGRYVLKRQLASDTNVMDSKRRRT